MNQLSKQEQIAAMVLQGLVSKYSMTSPDDQKTVCQLSVELADELLKQTKPVPYHYAGQGACEG